MIHKTEVLPEKTLADQLERLQAEEHIMLADQAQARVERGEALTHEQLVAALRAEFGDDGFDYVNADPCLYMECDDYDQFAKQRMAGKQ